MSNDYMFDTNYRLPPLPLVPAAMRSATSADFRGEEGHTRHTIPRCLSRHVLGQGIGQLGHVSGHVAGQVF